LTTRPGARPRSGALWPHGFAEQRGCLAPAEAATAAVLSQCRALIDATAEACVAVKFQLARFEVLGAPGWGALRELAAFARECGLLVIADGKRGDIDVTAA